MNRAISQLVIAALVFLAALAAYGYWYYLLTAQNARVAELAHELTQKQQSETSAQLAAQELTHLSGAEDDIQSYFVDPQNIVTFLEAQQSLGASLGSTVSVVSVTANGSPRPHIDLSLTVEGSFSSVMRTVGAIEFSPYDITVNTLNLSVAAAGDWGAAMTLSVGTASSSPKAKTENAPTVTAASTATSTVSSTTPIVASSTATSSAATTTATTTP